jgi:glucose/mannose transport system permease protein
VEQLAPELALSPAAALTVLAFLGGMCWTIYLSFTASRRFPDYALGSIRKYCPLDADGQAEHETWRKSKGLA